MSVADVQRLRAFALVVDLGSISGAADVLGYTQSAVSQQLAALEREVGTALVERSQRPLRATRAGANLRPYVERVLAAVGSADGAVDELRSGTPRLRLAAFTSALSSFVPAAVRDLGRAHSELVVQILPLETAEAIERVRSGDAEVAVVHHLPGLPVPETGGLERYRLLVDHLYVLLPEGHRLARRDAVSLADLEAEPLILPRRDTPGRFRSVVEHLCSQAGFAPRVAQELGDIPAVKAFVGAGIGVMPMHSLILAPLPSGATARPLAERPAGSRTIEALAPATGRAPAVDDLLERLAQAARAYSVPR